MSAPAWTPGPWEWALHKGDFKEVRAPSITASAIPEYVLSVEYEVSGYGMDVSTRIDVTEANARLIAAAPDLVLALRRMIADFGDYPASERPCDAFDLAHAALAKAGAA